MLQGVDGAKESRYGRKSGVRETGFAPFGLTRMVGLTLSVVLVTMLFWVAAAQAQSPIDVQYKERVTATEVSSDPADPADPADEAKAGGDGKSSLTASPNAAGGKSPLTASPNAAGGKSSLTASPKAGILPATGGPMLLVFVGAFLVVSGAGLMLLRRSDRGR